ncbi:MAG: 4-(cytidine 5'-diphospho)-2-C-methyl-D-erythritol kinase [Clostridia bacterium]
MICLKAHAKINWTLDILGTRADGYHLMDMLMQTVALHDTLWLELSDRLTLTAASESEAPSAAPSATPSAAPSPPSIPPDGLSAQPVPYGPQNLVYRAAEKLQEYTATPLGASMKLLKRIPTGAGMGGGSADAAAALIGLNELWQLRLSKAELLTIGLSLGADIPFMLTGGLAHVSGIGQHIEPLTPAPKHWLVLLQPCDGLSTREVFTAFDALPAHQLQRPATQAALTALLCGDLPALGHAMNNVLEAVSLKQRPEMARALTALEQQGAVRAMMTGSGSVVYGVFGDEKSAQSTSHALSTAYSPCMVTQTL